MNAWGVAGKVLFVHFTGMNVHSSCPYRLLPTYSRDGRQPSYPMYD